MKFFLFINLFLLTFTAFPQEDLMSELIDDIESSKDELEPVKYHFKSQYLINSVTTEMVAEGEMDFRITHRFGNVSGNSGGYQTLWGIDNATNIRFSFDYGLTDNILIGIGRSNTNQHIDGNLKIKLLQQKKQGNPISLVYFSNIAFTPKKDINNNFSRFIHRFSYTHQAVASSRVFKNLTLGIMPTLVHRNLVVNNASASIKDENTLFSLGGMFRWKTTSRLSIIAEYFYTFSELRSSNQFNYYQPLALGVEIETGGHVFHINISNTAGIITNDFIPNSPENWLDGGFKLGFTISRNFVIKR